MWPFRRSRPQPTGPPVGRAPSRVASEPASAAPAPPVTRPTREWDRLPPLQRATPTIQPLLNPAGFEDSLVSWKPPAPFLQPLGHNVTPMAPPGVVTGLIRPVAQRSGGSPLPLPRPEQPAPTSGRTGTVSWPSAGPLSAAGPVVAPEPGAPEPADAEPLAPEPVAPGPLAPEPVQPEPVAGGPGGQVAGAPEDVAGTARAGDAAAPLAGDVAGTVRALAAAEPPPTRTAALTSAAPPSLPVRQLAAVTPIQRQSQPESPALPGHDPATAPLVGYDRSLVAAPPAGQPSPHEAGAAVDALAASTEDRGSAATGDAWDASPAAGVPGSPPVSAGPLPPANGLSTGLPAPAISSGGQTAASPARPATVQRAPQEQGAGPAAPTLGGARPPSDPVESLAPDQPRRLGLGAPLSGESYPGRGPQSAPATPPDLPLAQRSGGSLPTIQRAPQSPAPGTPARSQPEPSPASPAPADPAPVAAQRPAAPTAAAPTAADPTAADPTADQPPAQPGETQPVAPAATGQPLPAQPPDQPPMDRPGEALPPEREPAPSPPEQPPVPPPQATDERGLQRAVAEPAPLPAPGLPAAAADDGVAAPDGEPPVAPLLGERGVPDAPAGPTPAGGHVEPGDAPGPLPLQRSAATAPAGPGQSQPVSPQAGTAPVEAGPAAPPGLPLAAAGRSPATAHEPTGGTPVQRATVDETPPPGGRPTTAPRPAPGTGKPGQEHPSQEQASQEPTLRPDPSPGAAQPGQHVTVRPDPGPPAAAPSATAPLVGQRADVQPPSQPDGAPPHEAQPITPALPLAIGPSQHTAQRAPAVQRSAGPPLDPPTGLAPGVPQHTPSGDDAQPGSQQPGSSQAGPHQPGTPQAGPHQPGTPQAGMHAADAHTADAHAPDAQAFTADPEHTAPLVGQRTALEAPQQAASDSTTDAGAEPLASALPLASPAALASALPLGSPAALVPMLPLASPAAHKTPAPGSLAAPETAADAHGISPAAAATARDATPGQGGEPPAPVAPLLAQRSVSPAIQRSVEALGLPPPPTPAPPGSHAAQHGGQQAAQPFEQLQRSAAGAPPRSGSSPVGVSAGPGRGQATAATAADDALGNAGRLARTDGDLPVQRAAPSAAVAPLLSGWLPLASAQRTSQAAGQAAAAASEPPLPHRGDGRPSSSAADLRPVTQRVADGAPRSPLGGLFHPGLGSAATGLSPPARPAVPRPAVQRAAAAAAGDRPAGPAWSSAPGADVPPGSQPAQPGPAPALVLADTVQRVGSQPWQPTDTRAAALATGLATLDRDGAVVFAAPDQAQAGPEPPLQRSEAAPPTEPPAVQRAAVAEEAPTQEQAPVEAPRLAEASSKDLDELALRLYPRISRQLKKEWRLSRERAGAAIDAKF